MSSSRRGGISKEKKVALLWVAAVFACIASFAIGWFLPSPNFSTPPLPLRLSGYPFISPLLACNSAKIFPQNPNLNNDVRSVIDAHKTKGDITDASVYFTDFTNGQWANVNGAEKYYPASLGKVPIMMAYFEMAEGSSTILDEQASYPLGLPDLNAQQQITPPDAITPGESYSIKDLLGYMIKYSDNNAADVLTAHANQDDLKSVYSDLQIPLVDNVTASTSNIMTSQQYSILFRTLYNATYLSRDFSEEALQLLTQTTFTQGIVAGVPSSTVVSHKFGLASFNSGIVTTAWELHDCGIVYAPSHPYLICVMTKGSSSIAAQERTIADISKTVYTEVENGYQ